MRLPRLFRDRAAELPADHDAAGLDRLRRDWPDVTFTTDGRSFTADTGHAVLAAGSPSVLGTMLASYHDHTLMPRGFVPPGP